MDQSRHLSILRGRGLASPNLFGPPNDILEGRDCDVRLAAND